MYCTEQKFTIIQIRHAISLYLQNEDVALANLNKEIKPLSLDLIPENRLLSKFKTLWVHPLSTYVEFSEKLTFLTP